MPWLVASAQKAQDTLKDMRTIRFLVKLDLAISMREQSYYKSPYNSRSEGPRKTIM